MQNMAGPDFQDEQRNQTLAASSGKNSVYSQRMDNPYRGNGRIETPPPQSPTIHDCINRFQVLTKQLAEINSSLDASITAIDGRGDVNQTHTKIFPGETAGGFLGNLVNCLNELDIISISINHSAERLNRSLAG